MVKLFANSGDPDQTPRSAASDLGLHCLQMSPLWDARLIWVKPVFIRAKPPPPLPLNSDGGPNYKHMFGVRTGVLYLIHETSQQNIYNHKHWDETKQTAIWSQNTRK